MTIHQTFRWVGLGAALGLSLVAAETPAPAKTLVQKFAKPDQTMEYHFTLVAPPFNDKNIDEALAPVLTALKAFGEVGKLEKPKEGSYLDTPNRLLDKAHLIVRERKGLFTIKARANTIEELVDLDICVKPKYELDYFGEIGYTISAEIRYEKGEWLADPTKATMGESLVFLKAKCPALYKQLEVILKPLATLTAPGVAKMWSAEFTPKYAPSAGYKESGISAWSFPGTTQTLVEVAWTGYQKDRAELDMIYFQVKEQLAKAGLLALDQSSKTERYFQAYYGATALDSRFGFLAKPAYLKHYEADAEHRVVLSPYQQVASREFPGYLDPALAPYDWVIDADGRVALVPETMHPYGRVYEKGFMRPEDNSKKKPGTAEHFGHSAALGGLPGRISGELNYDKKKNQWTVNNKSGRYSKNNADRTPEQLANAALLMREVLDTAGAGWGQARFLLEYGPDSAKAELEKSPLLQYEDPGKKSKAYIVALAAKATEKKP